MKIGILTYHRTHNYGGCLQAYATKIILEQLGHEVYYIDYWPNYHKRTYGIINIYDLKYLGFIDKLSYIKNSLIYYKKKRMRQKCFERFISQYIAPYCVSMDEKFDLVIYGSDQIWRKQVTGHYNPIYFGDNDIDTLKHVAFSASMGNLPTTSSDIEEVTRLVSHLNIISVREEDLRQFLVKQNFEHVYKTLDPTFLVPSLYWDKLVCRRDCDEEKYVLVYLLRGGFMVEDIYKFANKMGLRVKILKGTCNSKDKNDEISVAGPEDFIFLIKNAEFVFTSSFHGLVFSIIFRKQFYASFSENGSRGISLLKSVGLLSRYLEPYSSIPSSPERIDYNSVSILLHNLIEESLNFLKHITK